MPKQRPSSAAAWARADALFLRGLAQLDSGATAPEDWPRIAELVEQNGGWPLGGTDVLVAAGGPWRGAR